MTAPNVPTYKVQTFNRENAQENNANAVEFRMSDPSDLATNAQRIWVNTTDDEVKYTSDGVTVISINSSRSKVENESAQLGAELLNSSGWTSTGWTGNFNTGFIHTVGQVTPLIHSLPSTGTKLFQVSLTLSSTAPPLPPGFFTVTIGGSQAFDTYRGGGTVLTYNIGIKSVSDGNLVITPTSDFDGTVTNISVKEIITTTDATLFITDSTNSNSFEVRPTLASLRNTFIGVDAGETNTTGDSNTIVGNGSMATNTTGYWNSSLGVDALANNTVGSRNIAVGRVALQQNITGHRNIAVGTFALNANTHGNNNVGVGADALIVNTTGVGNVAVGTIALGANTTGINNVALGYVSLQRNTTGSNNISLGSISLDRNITGNGNVALGYRAGERVNADNNIAIGQYALNGVTTTQNSIAIGYQSQMLTTAAVNISIGANTCSNLTTGTDNVAMGDNALRNNTTGIRNIAIGNNAGQAVASSVVNRNVLIGHNAGAGLTTGADNNVIVGTSSGNPLTTGASNILIGFGVNTPAATTSNFMNIGDTLYGDLSTKKIGISVQIPTAHLHIKASTGAINTAPLKLTSGTLISVAEAGAIEFDGTNLYFTTNAGTRKTITAV